jgi:hypothetical protein
MERGAKIRLGLLGLGLVALGGWWLHDKSQPVLEGVAAEAPAGREPIAVVELFTSEGCSSCPPADALLAEIAAEAEAAGARVYTLSFHVDYWNDLGWEDPYSKREYTNRQRRYQQRFRNDSIYTPQMIVNGGDEFVGSPFTGRASARSAIATALGVPAAVGVTLSPAAAEADLTVRYVVSAPPAASVLYLALVENGLTTEVAAGENDGERLPHHAVVRTLVPVLLEPNATGEGQATVRVPDGVDRAQAELLGFVQDANSLAIYGATRAALP